MKPVQTPEPTPKPTPKPTYGKGKGKGYSSDSSSGKGGKGKKERSDVDYDSGKGKKDKSDGGKGYGSSRGECRNTVYEVAQLWSGPVIEPNGDEIQDPVQASTKPGQEWPYADYVQNKPGGRDVGYNVELCKRIKGDYWQCSGTYINLNHCEGHLAFSGVYRDETASGHFVITGGTGDFHGAKGSIYDEFDYDTGYAVRVVTIA